MKFNKIIAVAILAEILLISTGLGVAFTQGKAAFESHQSLHLAASAAGFPLLLATMEMFKIPAGIVLYKSQWFLKPVALAFLLAGLAATFETTVIAGSTWFRAIQFNVIEKQTELAFLEQTYRASQIEYEKQVGELRKGIREFDEQISKLETGSPAVITAQKKVSRLRSELNAARLLRGKTREQFKTERRDLENHLNKRIERGGTDAGEASKSLRSLPTEQQEIDTKMRDWDATDGVRNKEDIRALEVELNRVQKQLDIRREQNADTNEEQLKDFRRQREQLNEQLQEIITGNVNSITRAAEHRREIAEMQKEVSRLAGDSVIYDIAAKVFAKPAREINEDEANKVTFWVIGAAALAISAATGIAALLATHLEHQNPNLTLAQVIRGYVVTRRFRRKRTIIKTVEKPVEVIRYKWFPRAENIANFDKSIMCELFGPAIGSKQ